MRDRGVGRQGLSHMYLRLFQGSALGWGGRKEAGNWTGACGWISSVCRGKIRPGSSPSLQYFGSVVSPPTLLHQIRTHKGWAAHRRGGGGALAGHAIARRNAREKEGAFGKASESCHGESRHHIAGKAPGKKPLSELPEPLCLRPGPLGKADCRHPSHDKHTGGRAGFSNTWAVLCTTKGA